MEWRIRGAWTLTVGYGVDMEEIFENRMDGVDLEKSFFITKTKFTPKDPPRYLAR